MSRPAAGPPPGLSRRAVLGGGAAVVLLASCTGPAIDLPAPPGDGEDPDGPLLRRAIGHERAMLGSLEAVRRDLPSLRRRTQLALEVHTDHLDLLAANLGDVSVAADRPWRVRRSPARPGPALAALVAAEQALSGAHAEAALAAESGPFARVLASLAAAAAQQAVALAPQGPR